MQTFVVELRDLGTFQAMGLNRSGSLAVLARQDGIAAARLGEVDFTQSKEEVEAAAAASVERINHRFFNVHAFIAEMQFHCEKESLCAIGLANRCEFYDFREGGGMTRISYVNGHHRRLTDLSWHEQQKDLIATSGQDERVLIYDWRHLRRPKMTLTTNDIVSQVCWERLHGHVLATSNNTMIKLWDTRKSDRPVEYIEAHDDRITSLDFSTNRASRLVSAGIDNLVKFWDVKKLNEYRCERRLATMSPVRKIRYTPFGDGLVTLSSPTKMKEENVVMLWNSKNLTSPAYQFFGHAESIIEFCWKSVGQDHYQLVSYSNDLTLRIWDIDARLKDLCEVSDDEDDEDVVATSDDQSRRVATEAPVCEDGGELEIVATGATDESQNAPSAGPKVEEPIFNMEPDDNSGAASQATADPKSGSSAVTRSPSMPAMSQLAAAASTGSLSSEEASYSEQPPSIDTTEPISLSVEEEFEVSESSGGVGSSKPASRPQTSASRLTEAMACERLDSGHGSDSNIAMTLPSEMSATEGDAAQGASAAGAVKTTTDKLTVPGSGAGGSGVAAEGAAAATPVELASSAPTRYYDPTPLMQEFSLIQLSDNCVLERSDVNERVLIVLGKTTRHRIRLRIEFPESYPQLKAPRISVEDDQSTLAQDRLEDIRRRLSKAADYHFSKNKRSIEICLRQFEIAIDGLIQSEQGDTEKDYVSPLNVMGGMKNISIPFPRTCGARFCGPAKLVVFGQRKILSKQPKTPRSFSSIANHVLGGLSQSGASSKSIKTPSRRASRNRSSAGSSISEDVKPLIEDYNSRVQVYNSLGTQPFNINLAKKYFLNLKTMPANCYSNLGVAFNEAKRKTVRIQQGSRVVSASGGADAYFVEREEILKTWEILAFTVRPYEYRLANRTSACRDCGKLFRVCKCPWTETIKEHLLKDASDRGSGSGSQEELHPWVKASFGRQLVESRIAYHLGRSDIQTAATILCILDPPKRRPVLPKQAEISKSFTPATRTSSTPLISLPSGAPSTASRTRSSNSESDPSLDTGRDAAIEAIESASSSAINLSQQQQQSVGRGASLFAKRRNFSLNIPSFGESGGSGGGGSGGQKSGFQRLLSDTGAFASAMAQSYSTQGSTDTGLLAPNEEDEDERDSGDVADEAKGEPTKESKPENGDDDDLTLLDPANYERNELVKKWYSEFLRHLGMDLKSVEVAKFLKSNPDEASHRVDVFTAACDECGDGDSTAPDSDHASRCPQDRRIRPAVQCCSFCRLPARGLVTVCFHCGHGGHVQHLREWFQTHDMCPTGCGCLCLEKLKEEAQGEE